MDERGDTGASEPLLLKVEGELHDDIEERLLGTSGGAAGVTGWLGESLAAEGRSAEPSRNHSPLVPGYLTAAVHEPPKVHPSPRLFRRHHAGAGATSRARKTAWIVIDDQAKRSFLQARRCEGRAAADKRAVIAGLGLNIPIRDMRLLDFNLLTSETGKVFVRDNAILFSIEHVRLIITADKCLIPREGYEHNPLSNRFVDVLEEAVAEWVRQRRRIAAAAVAIDARAPCTPAAPPLDGAPGGGGAGARGAPGAPLLERLRAESLADSASMSSEGLPHELQPLPFELVVLETALKEVVDAAASQVKELESVALPALDALTKSITTPHLERVRKVKTRHQRLTTRCETLRDEVERFLHDDEDMDKMCLSRRKELEELYAAQRAAQAQQEVGGSAVGGSAFARSESLRHAPPLHLSSFSMRRTPYRMASVGSPPGAVSLLEGGPQGTPVQLFPQGIMGENLVIPSQLTRSVSGFYALNAAALAGCFAIFYSIILYMRWRKLI
eukprot:scaffold3.g6328.t1